MKQAERFFKLLSFGPLPSKSPLSKREKANFKIEQLSFVFLHLSQMPLDASMISISTTSCRQEDKHSKHVTLNIN